MAETIFWWVFLLSCVFGFFLAYGMIENLIRKWVKGHAGKQKLVPRTIDASPDPRGNGHGDIVIH